MSTRPTTIFTCPIEKTGMDSVRRVADIKVLKEEYGDKPIEKELAKAISDADALVNVKHVSMPRKIIEKGQNLKLIARHGIGYDCVDVKSATENNILVTIASEEGPQAVAEHALGFLIALPRKFKQATESIKSGKWEPKKMIGSELRNKTLGIIGLGKIGRIIGELVRPFKMNILAYDPYLTQKKAEEVGAKLTDLNTLLKESHFITIHAPLTEETRGMMGEKEFNLIKDGVYIVNCARSEIMNERDLYDAVIKEKVGGVGLDVFTNEPPTEDNPLLELANVLFTPHVAGVTQESLRRLAKSVADDVVSVLEGGLPRTENIVNESVLENSPWRERMIEKKKN